MQLSPVMQASLALTSLAALLVFPATGCGATTNGGAGGSGLPECQTVQDCERNGISGVCIDGACQAAILCEEVICRDTRCKVNGICDERDGLCNYTSLADGLTCLRGECLDGYCAPVGAFRCTEQGIRDAIAQGGGPHFFACDGPTSVVTEAELIIDGDVILDGQSYLIIDGNYDHPVLRVREGATAELRGITITKGPRIGRGIANHGTLTLTNSTAHDLSTQGIFNSATLTLTNSTISGMASGVTPICDARHGITGGGMVTLTNSTVSGNDVGIFHASGTLEVTNSTVSGTKLAIYNDGGAITLAHSLILEGCALFSDATFTSAGYNIESPLDTCVLDQPTDRINISAEALSLDPLGDNGGPTETHALRRGSIAIDRILPVDCIDLDGQPLTTDQRGIGRPQMSGCDIGAFERLLGLAPPINFLIR